MFRRREEPAPSFSPYRAFVVEEMILRDHLAVDRTSLANERTLLSYVRTALGCVIGGASAMHFLSGIGADVSGALLMAVGLAIAALGVYRYRWYKQRIEVVTAKSALAPPPAPEPD